MDHPTTRAVRCHPRNLGTHARSCRCAVSDTHLTGWQRTARNAASSNGEEWFIHGAPVRKLSLCLSWLGKDVLRLVRGGILESWNLGILESWSLGIGALTALALRNLGTHSLALTCVRDAARSCRCAVSDTHLTGWQRTARNAAGPSKHENGPF